LKTIIIVPIHNAENSVAQTCRAFNDRIEHRLRIRRRSTNNTHDFVCGDLLPQRLVPLASEPLDLFVGSC
jgi:hypothetical protein